jgi:DNA-binding response OmpR family regulator
MRIFVTEDDMDLAGAMADFLYLQGVECDFASSGVAGTKIAQKSNCDAMIIYLLLP